MNLLVRSIPRTGNQTCYDMLGAQDVPLSRSGNSRSMAGSYFRRSGRPFPDMVAAAFVHFVSWIECQNLVLVY
jgi:hypothetical protein